MCLTRVFLIGFSPTHCFALQCFAQVVLLNLFCGGAFFVFSMATSRTLVDSSISVTDLSIKISKATLCLSCVFCLKRPVFTCLRLVFVQLGNR